jgi:hypothetical protein
MCFPIGHDDKAAALWSAFGVPQFVGIQPALTAFAAGHGPNSLEKG